MLDKRKILSFFEGLPVEEQTSIFEKAIKRFNDFGYDFAKTRLSHEITTSSRTDIGQDKVRFHNVIFNWLKTPNNLDKYPYHVLHGFLIDTIKEAAVKSNPPLYSFDRPADNTVGERMNIFWSAAHLPLIGMPIGIFKAVTRQPLSSTSREGLFNKLRSIDSPEQKQAFINNVIRTYQPNRLQSHESAELLESLKSQQNIDVKWKALIDYVSARYRNGTIYQDAYRNNGKALYQAIARVAQQPESIELQQQSTESKPLRLQ